MPSSIRTKFIVLSAIQILFGVLLLFSFIGYSKSNSSLIQIKQSLDKRVNLLKSFKKSLSDLDILNKHYILFNDEKFLDQYNKSLSIHLGDSPLPKGYEFNFTELEVLGEQQKKDFETDISFEKRFDNLNLNKAQDIEFKNLIEKRALLLNLQKKSISLINGDNLSKTIDSKKAISLLNSEDYLLAQKSSYVSLSKLLNSFQELSSKRINKILGQIKFFKVLFIFSFIIGVLNLVASLSYINNAVITAIEKIKTAMLRMLSSKDENIDENLDSKRDDEIGDINNAVLEFKQNANKLKNINFELEEFNFKTADNVKAQVFESLGLVNDAEDAIENNDIDRLTETVSLLKDSLTKLENMIKDVIDVNKSKTQSEEDSAVDLDKLIEDEHLKLSHMPHYDKVDIVTTFFTPTQIYIKKTKLQLIVANLISNAIKYANMDKARSYLRIKTYENNGSIIIEFKDNGLGIPEKHQEKVFNMFCRFHPNVAYGTGLGLYMIKKSAESMNILVSYEPHSEGSIFRIEIPSSRSKNTN